MSSNCAILLVRVSTMEQDYDPQIDDLKKYANSRGYTKLKIIETKESGLVHISQLKAGFVSDVNAHVSLHQQIIVKVLEVDIPRKRIQLKLHK